MYNYNLKSLQFIRVLKLHKMFTNKFVELLTIHKASMITLDAHHGSKF